MSFVLATKDRQTEANVMKKLALLAIVGVMVVAIPSATYAVPQLKLTQGASTVTITDGGAGDLNAAAGAVTFSGAVGVFNVNVSTGLTKPVLGSATDPNLDLNSVDVSGAAGTLEIRFTDTDFSLNPATTTTFVTDIGGTSDGTLSYNLWLDDNNTGFAETDLLMSLGPFGPGPFSGSGTGSLPGGNPSGPFSLTLGADITHPGGQGKVTSFDAEVSVPEPTTLTLLGIGLAGLGFVSRRRSSLK